MYAGIEIRKMNHRRVAYSCAKEVRSDASEARAGATISMINRTRLAYSCKPANNSSGAAMLKFPKPHSHSHERGRDGEENREARGGNRHGQVLSQITGSHTGRDYRGNRAMEEKVKEVTPERHALQDNLVRYEISSACERRDRDQFIATCRDALHSALKEVGPIDPKRIHEVI